MANLRQLLGYLGQEKYSDLIEMARRYSQHQIISTPGQGKHYGDRGFSKEQFPQMQMQHQHDLVIHEVLIAIIRLINLFCEESEKSNDKSIFKVVTQDLNEHKREKALFDCLDVPSDDVKLAVVECLNNVPLSEFDDDEINQVVRQLS